MGNAQRLGSPPYIRGIQSVQRPRLRGNGITPVHTGNTVKNPFIDKLLKIKSSLFLSVYLITSKLPLHLLMNYVDYHLLFRTYLKRFLNDNYLKIDHDV